MVRSKNILVRCHHRIDQSSCRMAVRYIIIRIRYQDGTLSPCLVLVLVYTVVRRLARRRYYIRSTNSTGDRRSGLIHSVLLDESIGVQKHFRSPESFYVSSIESCVLVVQKNKQFGD